MLKKVPSLSSLTLEQRRHDRQRALDRQLPVQQAEEGQEAARQKLQKEQALAYPMSTFTYVILRPDSSNVALLKQFIGFAITPAEEKKGASLQFSPLPTAVYKQDEAAAKRL